MLATTFSTDFLGTHVVSPLAPVGPLDGTDGLLKLSIIRGIQAVGVVVFI